MTTNERQSRYRAKRRTEGDKRLSIWVKKDVADALLTVANTLSVTQKHLIEKLLLSAIATLKSTRQLA
ncbi:RepB family protein [Zoogloea oleivorans]|nr:RepB family protein [Zoogloea oleivorans]